MDDFRQKQKMRKVMYSKWMFGVLGLLLCVMVWKTWGIFQKERMAHRVLEESRLEHAALAQQAEELSTDIDHLNTEEGLEEVVRDRYGVAKDGEQVIVLIEEESTEFSKEGEETGFWAKVKAFFRND